MNYTIKIFLVLAVLMMSTLSFAQPGRGHGGHYGPGQGGYNPGYQGYGTLYSTGVNCYGGYQGLCNTNIIWNVNSSYGNTQGLVTVSVPTAQDPNERYERIMSCGAYGNTYVPWIRPQDTYVFKLYLTNNCSYIPYGTQALNQIVVHR